jgi:hypothetical protein
MAPPPPPPAAAVVAGAPPPTLPRSDTAVKNLASLCACCREPMLEDDPVQHPHRPFMERAIELSRIGGIEKRTGGCFGAVVVRNGVVSFFFFVSFVICLFVSLSLCCALRRAWMARSRGSASR